MKYCKELYTGSKNLRSLGISAAESHDRSLGLRPVSAGSKRRDRQCRRMQQMRCLNRRGCIRLRSLSSARRRNTIADHVATRPILAAATAAWRRSDGDARDLCHDASLVGPNPKLVSRQFLCFLFLL
mmetsp:Transcript_5193/g.8159  ORF Transcript_5193/g.8159 Transcript_5193/m.8159 type:complete len:127 (-) Transcript_5193:65-445(-)